MSLQDLFQYLQPAVLAKVVDEVLFQHAVPEEHSDAVLAALIVTLEGWTDQQRMAFYVSLPTVSIALFKMVWGV